MSLTESIKKTLFYRVKLIKIYFWITAITPLEAFIAPVVVLFYLQYLQMSFLQYSNIMAWLLIMNALLEIPMGWVSDRIGRRKALILGNSFYTLGLCMLLLWPSVWILTLALPALSFGSTLASGNLHSIGYEAFKATHNEGKFSYFLARLSSLSIAISAFFALLGGKLADQSLALPMLADISLLGIKVASGTILLLVLWPCEKASHMAQPLPLTLTKKDVVEEIRKIVTSLAFFQSLCLSCFVFATLRVSLNFYQPLLFQVGFNGDRLGLLFAMGILISALITASLTYLKKIKLVVNPLFYWLVLAILTLCGLLFYFPMNPLPLYFFIGFVFHQVIRILVPSICSFSMQLAIPPQYPYRTSLVSLENVLRALVTSSVMALSGFLTNTALSMQMVLVLLHALAVAFLAGFYFLSPIIENKK